MPDGRTHTTPRPRLSAKVARLLLAREIWARDHMFQSREAAIKAGIENPQMVWTRHGYRWRKWSLRPVKS